METNQLKTKISFRDEETNNEVVKTGAWKDGNASVEGKPLSTCVAKLRNSSCGHQRFSHHCAAGQTNNTQATSGSLLRPSNYVLPHWEQNICLVTDELGVATRS